MKIKIFLFTGILFAFAQSFAQEKSLSAKSVIDSAAKKSTLEESVSYLKKNMTSVQTEAEKRSLNVFLASVLERQGLYSEAQKIYVQAASINGSSETVVPSVQNRNSEELVIDAVRCALCAGDYQSAESYLNSSVRNSKDENVRSYVRLYEQWAALCKAKTFSDTKESLAMLKTYSELDSMSSVRPSVLLTLWHLTGEQQFADKLKKIYPKSMEASVVRGEVQILPTPFWYFVPRSGVDLPEISEAKNEPASVPSSESEKKPASSSKTEKIVRQQLGLFRDEANAKALVDRVAKKGFKADITTETRPSGTKYYLVVVSENEKGSIGEELRTAGFECYPVFE